MKNNKLIVGFLLMAVIGMGFSSTSFAAPVEPTLHTFYLNSTSLNSLETQKNLIETQLTNEVIGEKGRNGKVYSTSDLNYYYRYVYSFPVPAGDRFDVMLPTYASYGPDHTLTKVEWVGNIYPKYFKEDLPGLNCTGVSTKKINNTDYTIYSFKTTDNKFEGIRFDYRVTNQNEFNMWGQPLTKFGVWIYA